MHRPVGVSDVRVQHHHAAHRPARPRGAVLMEVVVAVVVAAYSPVKRLHKVHVCPHPMAVAEPVAAPM